MSLLVAKINVKVMFFSQTSKFHKLAFYDKKKKITFEKIINSLKTTVF